MSVEPTPETRILLYTKRTRHDDSLMEIIAQPVHFTAEGSVRNISTDHYRPHALADFEVRALVDPNIDTFGETYGWSREYRDVFSVDTERAAVMAKHLRALDRGMEKLEKQFSYAKDFQAYLARVATVLKIPMFGYKVADGGHAFSYDGNEYRWGDASLMDSWVTRELADYRKKVSA
jgi:hypothetical protein